MRTILDIQKQLMPDVIEELQKRYMILHYIKATGLIGRRTLAARLGFTERVLRSETDFLKNQDLIVAETMGMRLSEKGAALTEALEPMMKELLGLADLEAALKSRFGLQHVLIVPGDCDASPHVKSELGRAAAFMLQSLVRAKDVIAVTGGSTMAEVADGLSHHHIHPDILFVPARGGLGERVESQANTIASKMAERTGGEYRLLHVPDNLSEETYHSLRHEPEIQEVLQVIRQARIVIHGIGDAIVMANRRKASSNTMQLLSSGKALSEAFGYYFDRDGQVVHKMLTLGLRLEDIQKAEIVMAVAGGKSKGEAIASVMKAGHEKILISDEAAARSILEHS